jgi:hypothetical protein
MGESEIENLVARIHQSGLAMSVDWNDGTKPPKLLLFGPDSIDGKLKNDIAAAERKIIAFLIEKRRRKFARPGNGNGN